MKDNSMAKSPTFNFTPLTSPIGEFAISIGGFQKEDFLISGTATIIAPYLAITARHVVEHYWREFQRAQIKASDVGTHLNLKPNFNVMGIQILENGKKGALWNIQRIFFSTTTDIAYLYLHPFSDEARKYKWRFPKLDLLPPKVGTRIHAFGFRNSKATSEGNKVEWYADGTTATGDIIEIHDLRRDTFSVNFPCIHTNARFDGGMSGGPVFNSEGKLCAVISSNLPPVNEGEDHVSYAALIWPSMNTPINLKRDGINFDGFYPILELCQGNFIKADNHEKVELQDNANGKNQRVALKIPE